MKYEIIVIDEKLYNKAKEQDKVVAEYVMHAADSLNEAEEILLDRIELERENIKRWQLTQQDCITIAIRDVLTRVIVKSIRMNNTGKLVDANEKIQ